MPRPGRQLLRELREAFADLRREHTTRCLVLKSAVPGTFCAGADLKVSPEPATDSLARTSCITAEGCHLMQERIRMTQQDVSAFVNDLRSAMEDLQVFKSCRVCSLTDQSSVEARCAPCLNLRNHATRSGAANADHRGR